MNGRGAPPPGDDLWREVLAVDFVRSAWEPLAGDLGAHPALDSLLGNLAAHAAAFAALARQWGDALDEAADQGSPAPRKAAVTPAPGSRLGISPDSPILALWRPLFQPWLEVS